MYESTQREITWKWTRYLCHLPLQLSDVMTKYKVLTHIASLIFQYKYNVKKDKRLAFWFQIFTSSLALMSRPRRFYYNKFIVFYKPNEWGEKNKKNFWKQSHYSSNKKKLRLGRRKKSCPLDCNTTTIKSDLIDKSSEVQRTSFCLWSDHLAEQRRWDRVVLSKTLDVAYIKKLPNQFQAIEPRTKTARPGFCFFTIISCELSRCRPIVQNCSKSPWPQGKRNVRPEKSGRFNTFVALKRNKELICTFRLFLRKVKFPIHFNAAR